MKKKRDMKRQKKSRQETEKEVNIIKNRQIGNGTGKNNQNPGRIFNSPLGFRQIKHWQKNYKKTTLSYKYSHWSTLVDQKNYIRQKETSLISII